MKKKLKSVIIVALMGIVIVISSLVTLFLLPSPPKGPKANTYAKNSIIDTVEYAVKFSDGDILIENSLNISKGKVNGYSIINSTILDNCTLNSNPRLGYIAVYNDATLTLRNIEAFNLKIVLFDNSSLILQNCAIFSVYLIEFSSALIDNSNVEIIGTTILGTTKDFSLYQTSLIIQNDSQISDISLLAPATFSIKNSSIVHVLVRPYYSKSVFGKIEKSYIHDLYSYGDSFLDIFGSYIHTLLAVEQSQVILNSTTISAKLINGIQIYSGSVNITDGNVDGSSYINNTKNINSIIPRATLLSVTVNNSAIVYISNYSCNIYIYDFGKAIISNTNNLDGDIYGRLENSSKLTIENSSSIILECFDNSSLIIRKNSNVDQLRIQNSNMVKIDNSSIGFIEISSQSDNLSDNTTITNSVIDEIYIWPLSVVYIENCSIQSLHGGFSQNSGSLMWDSSGLTGSGTYLNYTTLVNNEITTSFFKLIDISGSAQLTIYRIYNGIQLRVSGSSKVSLENTLIESIIINDSSVVTIINCPFSYFSIMALYSYGNSRFSINQDTVLSGSTIYAYENSDGSINNANIDIVMIGDTSTITIRNSHINSLLVCASNSKDYSVKLYDSVIWYMSTLCWGT